MKALHGITFILLVIGGLNWLLVGLVGWDISQWLGGMDSLVARVIYILVGLSGVYMVISHKQTCKYCMGGSSSGMGMGNSGGSSMPPRQGM